MNKTRYMRISGLFLILSMALLMVSFTLLSASFEYPEILRKGVGYTLEKYPTVPGLGLMWYGMALGTFLLIPIALLLHQILVGERSAFLPFATAWGILAGVFNILGFIRWVFGICRAYAG